MPQYAACIRSTASGRLQCCCPPGSPAAKAPPTKYDLGPHRDAKTKLLLQYSICATGASFCPTEDRVQYTHCHVSGPPKNRHDNSIEKLSRHSLRPAGVWVCIGLYRSAEGGNCRPSFEDSHAALPSHLCPKSYSSTRAMKESLRAAWPFATTSCAISCVLPTSH